MSNFRLYSNHSDQQALISEVNRVVDMVEYLISSGERYAYVSHQPLVAFDSGNLNRVVPIYDTGYFLYILRAINEHIHEIHFVGNFPFHGFSIIGQNEYLINDRLLKCSCGEFRFPIDNGLYNSSLQGMSFPKFIEKINWAYCEISSNHKSYKDFFTPEKKKERAKKRKNDPYFNNPIIGLEL